MAGGNHPPNKPPHPPLSSAIASSSSHRSKTRQGSSSDAAIHSSHQKPSSSFASGDSKKSKPTSEKDQPLNNGNAKPPTPKPRNISSNNKPSPIPPQHSPILEPTPSKLPPFPFLDPPPPPSYGFHMLDRRTIVLADGSVRSYFALPPDYQDFAALPPRPGPGFGFERKLPMSPEFGGPEFRPHASERGDGLMSGRSQEFWHASEHQGHVRRGGLVDGPGSSMKRKFGDDEREGRDGFERQRQQLLQFGNSGGNVTGMPGTSGIYMGREGEEMRAAKYMRTGPRNVSGLKHNQVDQGALKKAFLHFVKLIYENANQRRKYLAVGKQELLHCIVCGRSSKDFSDTHSLIMHAYYSDKADLTVDHLGLHKALCILMGWNYGILPDNSKEYQLLPAHEAAANVDDLILWPPLVLIHNTLTGKSRDGRTEGMGNRAMDNYIRELGIGGGKSKSLYSRDGHLGITLIKFAADRSGLEEALRLAEYFEKDDHGRKDWARVESLASSKDDENNPNLVKVDQKTGEKKRIFYGYLANVSDIDKVDFETRKKIMIESQREYQAPK